MVRHVKIMCVRLIHVMVWRVREMRIWADMSGQGMIEQGMIGQGT
jgi:hypothetical protein